MTGVGNNKFLNFLQSSNNFLLVKDSMGKAKPSTRDLPGGTYTYGKKLKPDAEGVGALISSWDIHKSSTLPRPDKDFKKSNAVCIAEGACTAAKQTKFRANADLRIKTASQKERFHAPDMIFGVGNRPSTPIKAVITGFYGTNAADNLYQAFTPKSQSRNIRSARTTKAADKRNEAIRASLQEPQRNLFKLKKFASVQAKTETRRKQTRL